MSDKPPAKRRLKAPSLREKALETQKQKKDIKPRRLSKTCTAAVKNFSNNRKKLTKYKLYRIVAKIFHFIGLILLPRYFRTSFQELKLVTWPNRRETRKLTTAVIMFSVVFGAFVATLDYGLSHLFKLILIGKS